MSRKWPSLAQQIAPMHKRYMAGKIDVHSLGYRYGTDGYTNSQGVHFAPSLDDSGAKVELYRRRSVRCPLPSLYPSSPVVRGACSVPESQCKKCIHRLPKGCCDVLRRIACGEGLREPVVRLAKEME